ncbi:MAG: hypothetical protein PUB17_03995 [Lachnospiraceae bacterium]|nr:hypothetical protein [Lachnospiraceae bacterium]
MKLKQMILTIALSLCMAAACLPKAVSADDTPQGRWTDYAAASFDGGSGTKADPYKIATAEQLALLAKEVNSGVYGSTHTKEYFILTADIDLSGHVWTPIGYESYASGGGSAQAFEGYFNGNNKKITGLYVDERKGDSYGKNRSAGLFGCISALGDDYVIKNVIIENGTVYAGDGNTLSEESYGAGLLVGSITTSYGTDYAAINNCKVSGAVNSTKRAGGLVGDASYTIFSNCTADVRVDGYSVSGGFVGNAFVSQFSDCTANGKVTSKGWSTGGFAGILYYGTTVNHCAAFGNVEAGDWNLGGFVGYTESNIAIANSIAMGDVKSNVTDWQRKTGGFIGTAWDDTIKLEKCHAGGKITAVEDDTVGGFLGSDNGNNIAVSGCSFDNIKNAALSGAGSASAQTYGITAQNTASVDASVCMDYYGGHDMVEKAGQDPTCTDDGYEAGNECKRCGYKEGFAVIPATGHTGGNATCTAKAVCEVCRQEYGELDSNNHADLKHIPAKAATKDAEGNIEYWYCGGCDKYYSDAAASKEISKADTVTAKLPAGNDFPQTGDNAGFMMWFTLLLISGATVIGMKSFGKDIIEG